MITFKTCRIGDQVKGQNGLEGEVVWRNGHIIQIYWEKGLRYKCALKYNRVHVARHGFTFTRKKEGQ